MAMWAGVERLQRNPHGKNLHVQGQIKYFLYDQCISSLLELEQFRRKERQPSRGEWGMETLEQDGRGIEPLVGRRVRARTLILYQKAWTVLPSPEVTLGKVYFSL